jgi:hypothetical protein
MFHWYHPISLRDFSRCEHRQSQLHRPNLKSKNLSRRELVAVAARVECDGWTDK